MFISSKTLLAALVLLLGAIWAPLQAASIKPASPQPALTALTPGLSVIYYMNAFRHVDQIPEWAEYKDGTPGDPLPDLNYRVGEGEVLTSGNKDGVGAHIKGFIYLEEAGTYAFAAQSNDGLRVLIGGQMVVDDPDVHGDRYSDPVEVEVPEAGWHRFEALYFERKSTSTLQLFWLRPDDEEGSMSVVPAEAFAH